jgi:hypothetical protein
MIGNWASSFDRGMKRMGMKVGVVLVFATAVLVGTPLRAQNAPTAVKWRED